MTRREFLACSGSAAVALMTGCVASPPLPKSEFTDFGGPDQPYLGLATSLLREYDYAAEVTGTLPAALRGVLYRNGPGLFDRGGLRKRSLLDGDGLIQRFHFHDGGVRFRCRFVQTPKFREEAAAGRFLFPTWSTLAPGGIWNNFWGPGRIRSQAGVTVFPWQGRLYAFDESSLPFALDPDTLETLGESRLGVPPETPVIFAAHAKLDPATGEWLHFGIQYGRRVSLHLTCFAPDGRLSRHRVVELPRYVYLHDWFVSSSHVMLSLHPLEVAVWGPLLGIRSILDSLRWHPGEGNLLLVLPRDLSGEPLRLATGAEFMWHSVNAFEQRGELIADFVGYANPDHLVGPTAVVHSVMTGGKGVFRTPGLLRRYRIDPGAGRVSAETLAEGNFEWPRMDERLRCRPYRFVYLCAANQGEFFWSAVERHDLQTGKRLRHDFGAGCFCTEPVFVPRPGVADEGSGWVLTEVYDSRTRRSFLAVLDGERLADGPVARVMLRHHVPFSYHGWWVGVG
ncbi:MAG: dioxygenase [Geobacter sp.]|nr:dioxygenase [Geobacter sp.]